MFVPKYTNIVEMLFTTLDAVLNNYVYQGYTSIADHLRQPLGLLIVLYIMIMGIAISQCWIKVSISNFVKETIKIGLIYTFAMHWSTFSFYVVKGVEVSATQIGDWFTQKPPMPLPQFAGDGVNGTLQSVLIEVAKVGVWVWNTASFHNITPYILALSVWFFGFLALFVAIIQIAIAKMMLAILFTIAPLCICFTMFKPTYRIFDAWLGAIAGFAFFLILIPAAVALGLSLMQWVLGDVYQQQALHVGIVSFIPLMIVGMLSMRLISMVTEYARLLGSNISSISNNSMLPSVIGGYIGAGTVARGGMNVGLNVGKAAVGSATSVGQAAFSATKGAGSSIVKGIRYSLYRGKS